MAVVQDTLDLEENLSPLVKWGIKKYFRRNDLGNDAASVPYRATAVDFEPVGPLFGGRVPAGEVMDRQVFRSSEV